MVVEVVGMRGGGVRESDDVQNKTIDFLKDTYP